MSDGVVSVRVIHDGRCSRALRHRGHSLLRNCKLTVSSTYNAHHLYVPYDQDLFILDNASVLQHLFCRSVVILS